MWSVNCGSNVHVSDGAITDRGTGCVRGNYSTFDSGGISIKPSDKMWEMKGDMSGAAAVFSAFTLIAQVGQASRPFPLVRFERC